MRESGGVPPIEARTPPSGEQVQFRGRAPWRVRVLEKRLLRTSPWQPRLGPPKSKSNSRSPHRGLSKPPPPHKPQKDQGKKTALNARRCCKHLARQGLVPAAYPASPWTPNKAALEPFALSRLNSQAPSRPSVVQGTAPLCHLTSQTSPFDLTFARALAVTAPLMALSPQTFRPSATARTARSKHNLLLQTK